MKEDTFKWHSSLGIDSELSGKTVLSSLPASKTALSMFRSAGADFMVHKTKKCLWKYSEDRKTIIPAFESDSLTEDDVIEAMKAD